MKDVVDLMSIFKNYWSKIGVDLEIKIYETAVHRSIQMGGKYEGMIIGGFSVSFPFRWYYWQQDSRRNLSKVNDRRITDTYKQIEKNYFNEAVKRRLAKEICPYILSQAYVIQPPLHYIYEAWQPWLKGYHGEWILGLHNFYNFAIYPWIDQDMKQEMTGKR